MKQYILERVKEPSTWRGVVLILAAFGVALSPEQKEAIITIGLGIAGILGAATRG